MGMEEKELGRESKAVTSLGPREKDICNCDGGTGGGGYKVEAIDLDQSPHARK